MKNNNSNNKISGKGMMMVGAGLAAAGAGAYYLLGPKAKEHQKKAKNLLEKMKKEVSREIKKVKKVTPPLYHKAVDAVSKNYAKQYKLYEKDIKAFGKILKDEWNTVSSKTAKTVKKSKSLAKKLQKK